MNAGPQEASARLPHGGLLAATVATLSAVAAASAIFAWSLKPLEYRAEWTAAVGASGALAFASLAATRLLVFRLIHAVRVALVLIAQQICRAADPAVALLLLVPLVVETAIYDEAAPAIGISTLALALACAQAALLQGLRTAVAIAVVGGIATLVSTLMVRYRELVVDERQRVQSLTTAVSALTDANVAIQSYAGNVESESAGKERQRITRELHDVVGYTLTNIMIMMDACKVLRRRDPAALDDVFAKVRDQAERALQETRETLYRLREVQAHVPEGLRALNHLTRAFTEATGIRAELNAGNVPWSLGPQLDSAILRLAQEALTNAFRHGKADRVRINLWQTQSEIRISIWDNGRGMDAGAVEGIGLTGMRERFAAVGGSIHPHNVADGFQLDATIPFLSGEPHE